MGRPYAPTHVASSTSQPLPTGAAMLRRLVAEFERRGWRDDGETALAVVQATRRRGRPPTAKEMAELVPTAFLATNATTRARVRDACRVALGV